MAMPRMQLEVLGRIPKRTPIKSCGWVWLGRLAARPGSRREMGACVMTLKLHSIKEYRALGLTPRQRECKDFIAAYMARNAGVSPSYDEIRQALGLSSRSHVLRLITGLEDRGHLEREPFRHRTLKLIDEANEVAVEHVLTMVEQDQSLRQILKSIGQYSEQPTTADVVEAVRRAWLGLKKKGRVCSDNPRPS